MNQTKRIVVLSFLIGLEVILSRFLSISTPIVKISFSFVPISFAAILYGWMYAGITAALADFIGAVLFPVAFYFPGFTLTAFLTGVVFGFFFYGERYLCKIIFAVCLVNLLLNLILNSIWLLLITEMDLKTILAARAIKSILMIPIEIFVIYFFCYQGVSLLRMEARHSK